MRAKTVNESKEIRIPLSEITWGDVEHLMTGEYTKRLLIPSDGMSSTEIRSENDFDWWKKEFTERYGEKGDVIIRYGHGQIEGNPKFNRIKDITSDGVSQYYKDKGSGGYTGD